MTQPEERRVDHHDMKIDIAIIKEQLKVISATLKNTYDLTNDNSEKLIRLNGIKEEFKGHVTTTRWLFVFITTIALGLRFI